MNIIWLAFVTGLTTGGLSCLAVQGGLLASTLSTKQKNVSPIPTIGIFLLAKLIAYTLLGLLLGLLGSKINITPQLQGFMQIFAGLYMIATAANLLKIHPIFRYVVIQPPRFAYKFMRKQSKIDAYITPFILGFLTFLIPCGVTQGMMIMAIASGNPITAAAILFAFTLGTSPIFATLGMTTSKIIEKKSFLYIGSTIVLFLGLLSINTGQILRGSPHNFQNYWKAIVTPTSKISSNNGTYASINQEGKQEVTVDVTSYGYKTSARNLQVGVPVKLTLKTNQTQGCSRAFTIPTLNISKILPETGTEIVEFTPTKTGILGFTCSMGMFNGEFKIL